MSSLVTVMRRALPSKSSLRSNISRTPSSAYHSYEHDAPPPYPEAQAAILSNALRRVPINGFTKEALTLGAKDAGYLDISTNLFPDGPFALVNYHLVMQRLDLKNRVQFPNEELGVGRKVRSLILARLRGNVEADVVGHWKGALAQMSLAENIPASLKELGKLSDEIWFLAGDTAVDASWYTKRASLASVYAATEIYQTQDQSTEYKDTEEFLDRRLEEVRTFGGAIGNTLQWAGFQTASLVNLLRSKGLNI